MAGSISSTAEGKDVLPSATSGTDVDLVTTHVPTSGAQGAVNSAYIEPLELKTQSSTKRKEAWLLWREKRREDRKWAFARLRDALALQDFDMIDMWKATMMELGPDDTDESMPSFETAESQP